MPDTLEETDLFSSEVLGESEDKLTVDTPADANRLFGAIRAIEDEIEQLKNERESMIEEIEDFYDPKIEGRKERKEFLQSKIEAYVRSTGETVSVPFGKSYTQTRQRFNWDETDEEQLETYAEHHCPEAVEVEKKINKRTLKQYLRETGDDIVPVEEVTSTVTYTQSPSDDD